MKQVVARAGEVYVIDVPKPSCPEKGVLVKNEFSVISSGTESWTIESTEPLSAKELLSDKNKLEKAIKLVRDVYRREGVDGLIDYVKYVKKPEVPLGYSSSGIVVEVGRYVNDVSVGERVACTGEGIASHSEYQAVPRNMLVKVPKNVSMRDASFCGIGAIAMHAVRVGMAQIGESVCVIGAGLVGNLVIQVLLASGCNVASVDLREERLSLAEKVGSRLCVKSSDPEIEKKLIDFTNGNGFDKVFICAATRSSEPVNLASSIARSRGSIVVVGRVGMEIDRKNFYQKELTLLMSRSLGPGRYDISYEQKGIDYPIEYVRWTLNRNMESFLQLLEHGKVEVKHLFGKEYEVQDAKEAYRALGTNSNLSVVLRYSIGEEKKKEISERLPSLKGNQGKVCVAIIGPGAFAREILIPTIKRNKFYRLKWVVSSNPIHAEQAARRYGFENQSCSVDDVLADEEVELVIISSRNDTHSQFLIKAMKAGKISFVEKPLCISREELEEIKKVQEETSMPVIVGFNRRYSKLIGKIKNFLVEGNSVFIANYRVSTGFLEHSRWSSDVEYGGGRIVHECCHFVDLFNFLAGETNPEVSVYSSGIDMKRSYTRDNIVASFKYKGGSVCNLVYTSLGSNEMGRERLELFSDYSSVVMNDFVSLEFFGKKRERIVLKKQDKGYEAEFEELYRFLRNKEASLIKTEEVYGATETTFTLEELVRKVKNSDI
jgi:predicted dehydrogenase/threonine dehydrogenase-like Zn-dependent dehydrogenase